METEFSESKRGPVIERINQRLQALDHETLLKLEEPAEQVEANTGDAGQRGDDATAFPTGYSGRGSSRLGGGRRGESGGLEDRQSSGTHGGRVGSSRRDPQAEGAAGALREPGEDRMEVGVSAKRSQPPVAGSCV